MWVLAALFLTIAPLPQSALLKLDPQLRALPFIPPPKVERLDFVEEGRIRALALLSGPPDRLERMGIEVRTVAGGVASLEIPLRLLGRVGEMPGLRYVEPAYRLRPCEEWLELSVPDIGADLVRRSSPSLTGKGVIIGVIDTGIDWGHPDFLDENGRSRILFIWDQTVTIPGRSPPKYGYGSEWSREEIEAGLCPEIDTTGHGTHVAGIAAGAMGVAPGAYIIFVKSHLFDDQIVDGLDFILRKAEELGMPVVVNMSFGGHKGPHDGRALLDRAVDELMAGLPGRVAVSSAGNDGDDLIHAGGILPPPSGGRCPYLPFGTIPDDDSAHIEIWYSSTGRISVRLLLPDEGDRSDHGIGWVEPGDSVTFEVKRGPLRGATVHISSDLPHPLYPDLGHVEVWIWNGGDPAVPVDEAEFRLELKGAGVRFDAFCRGYTRFRRSPDPMALKADGEMSISSPSSARYVISVASYATRDSWQDVDGEAIRRGYARVGEISVFSSRGPLRNGGRKPEIAAPGQFIASTLSRLSWQRRSDIFIGGRRAVFEGTSMASPHVAGALALLFQMNPRLSHAEIRSRLIASAQDMGRPGWDGAWGYGKLRVPELLGIPRPPAIVEVKAGDGEATIKWAPVGDEPAGYILKTPAGSIDVGDGTSWTIKGLRNGEPAMISVIAYSRRGLKSAPASVIVVPNPEGLDLSPPKPPVGVRIYPMSGAVKVAWKANDEPDVTGYKVHWGDSPGRYEEVKVVRWGTECVIDGLRDGERVFAVVTAFDGSGNESDPSEEVSVVVGLPLPKLEPRQMPGSPFELKGDSVASPLVCDLTGDGYPELIVASSEGEIQARSYRGGLRLLFKKLLGRPIRGQPTGVDLDGDGLRELVLAAGDELIACRWDGAEMWRVDLGAEPLCPVSAGDLDGDGLPEIVVPLPDGSIRLLNADGRTTATWRMEEVFTTSAALADLDGDELPEIVVCGRNGKAYVVDPLEDVLWEFEPAGGCSGRASPVASDFNGDGLTEVVVISNGGKLYMLDRWGREIWSYNTRFRPAGTPGMGDLTGDGLLELLLIDEVGEVYAFDLRRGEIVEGFPVQLEEGGTGSPLLLDLDDDGELEVMAGFSRGISYGFVYGLEGDGRLIDRFPLVTGFFINTPGVGDLDGDGDLEVIVSTMGGPADKATVEVWDTPLRAGDLEWPMPMGDPGHTGFRRVEVRPEGVDLGLKPDLWGGVKGVLLLPIYPNPFNGEVWMPFILARKGRVRATVFDIGGRVVWRRDLGVLQPGVYISKRRAIRWDGRDLSGRRVASGIYICSIELEGEASLRKAVLAK